MLFKLSLLLLVAVTAASAQTRVALGQCPPDANGVRPLPLWFESTMCTGTVCTLPRGGTFTGRAAFAPSRAFSTLSVQLRAVFNGNDFPLSVPPGSENACASLEQGSCPTAPNAQHVWSLQIPVGTQYPQIQGLEVTLALTDATGTAACAVVPFNIA